MNEGSGAGIATIREAGDSALLLELERVIDARVNARVVAIAAALRRAKLAGVRDIVPTFRSVAVMFDPLRADADALAAAMHRACESSATTEERAPIDVPVTYGGEAGPDLDEVAAFAGCSAREVIERHSARVYRVFMLGFLPGFAYMGTVDDSIAAPRRAAPRQRVPAGSVGIAGHQTGVYPFDSPGGWQIIGRTDARLFDPGKTPPALFAPGDRVRFVAQTADPVAGLNRTVELPGRADTTVARFVTVLRSGLFTTIQDEGRWGYQHLGVPVSGPMDQAAHRRANLIVGNRREAATLEVTLVGPELRMEHEGVVAVAGADLGATLDGADVPRDTAITCRPGGVIRFGARRTGARAYIAFAGGIASPAVLGSRATHVVSKLGGVEGRAVRAGDQLPLGEPHRDGKPHAPRLPDGSPTMPAVTSGSRLRVLPGPQDRYFGSDALAKLQRMRFTISAHSDRMGYRLSAAGSDRFNATGTMISDVTFMGGVQVPPSGDPILLMADRQTTGGYPQIATVITADLPAAGQLAPGDWVEFEVCTRADAISALIAQERRLLALS